jgi:hypothetical protein
MSFALIVVIPAATPVARPLVLMVAADVLDDAQVTWLVRFCVELSENVPVAVNCWVAPLPIEGLEGVTAIDARVGAVTVSAVLPLMLPSVAEIVVVPTPVPVASPDALIVATDVPEDAHVTLFVRSCVVPSVKVPVAVNCCVFPLTMLGPAGVTAIERSTGAVTVSVAWPVTPLMEAVIVDEPSPSPVASPVAVIEATVGDADAHVT